MEQRSLISYLTHASGTSQLLTQTCLWHGRQLPWIYIFGRRSGNGLQCLEGAFWLPPLACRMKCDHRQVEALDLCLWMVVGVGREMLEVESCNSQVGKRFKEIPLCWRASSEPNQKLLWPDFLWFFLLQQADFVVVVVVIEMEY